MKQVNTVRRAANSSAAVTSSRHETAAPAQAEVELRRDRRPVGVVVAAAVCCLTVLVVASLVGGAASPAELADPGPVTRWGLLVARTGYDLAAIGTLGLLLVVGVLLPKQRDDLGPDALRLLRYVPAWAAAWAAAAILSVLFILSRVTGSSLPSVLAPDVLPLILELAQTRAMLSSAWLAVLVAVGARWMRSPAAVLLLAIAAVSALLFPLMSGHGSTGADHSGALVGLAVHVAAAAGWVGGLAALVVYLRRSVAALSVALPRYSTLALICFAAVAVSGAYTGWSALVSIDQLWTTSYGVLLLGKIAALAVLGVMGHLHRRRTVAAAAQHRPGAFVRLAAVELVVMACAAALAVGLANSPPPHEDGGHAAGSRTAVAPLSA